MRYLPVFLDLQSGKVLLVGAGELVRAKLRLLAAATRGSAGMRPTAIMISRPRRCRRARIELAEGDPLVGRSVRRHRHALRRRRRDRRCHVGAREGGRAARQCDGRPRAFDFHLSRDRRSRRRRRRGRHRRHVAGGRAARPRAHRSRAAGAHRRSRRLHRTLAQRRCMRAFRNSRCAAASGSA